MRVAVSIVVSNTNGESCKS